MTAVLQPLPGVGKRYTQLFAKFPLRPIGNEQEYDRGQHVVQVHLWFLRRLFRAVHPAPTRARDQSVQSFPHCLDIVRERRLGSARRTPRREPWRSIARCRIR